MKMSELVLAVGDENIRFQNLLNDAVSIDMTPNGSKITFYTDELDPADLMDRSNCKTVGLVLWLPKDRVDAAIAAATRAENGGTER
jgi:hypothetical protein